MVGTDIFAPHTEDSEPVAKRRLAVLASMLGFGHLGKCTRRRHEDIKYTIHCLNTLFVHFNDTKPCRHCNCSFRNSVRCGEIRNRNKLHIYSHTITGNRTRGPCTEDWREPHYSSSGSNHCCQI